MDMNNKYKQLLMKFCGDEDMLELLRLVREDDIRVREIYYSSHNEYPQNRDLIGKLLIDLDTTKQFIIKSNKQVHN